MISLVIPLMTPTPSQVNLAGWHRHKSGGVFTQENLCVAEIVIKEVLINNEGDYGLLTAILGMQRVD